MNSLEKKNINKLKCCEEDEDISQDEPVSEHYVVKGFEGKYKKDSNKSESKWC